MTPRHEPVIAACEHCGHRFELPHTSAGSIQNCPACGRATTVAGRFDPGWEAVQVLAVVLAAAAGVLTGLAAGPLAGCAVSGGLVALWWVVRLAL